MIEAAEQHITTEALMWNRDNQTTKSGMVSAKSCLNIALFKVY